MLIGLQFALFARKKDIWLRFDDWMIVRKHQDLNLFKILGLSRQPEGALSKRGRLRLLWKRGTSEKGLPTQGGDGFFFSFSISFDFQPFKVEIDFFLFFSHFL